MQRQYTEMLTVLHWTRTCGHCLAANRHSSERWTACRHAKCFESNTDVSCQVRRCLSILAVCVMDPEILPSFCHAATNSYSYPPLLSRHHSSFNCCVWSRCSRTELQVMYLYFVIFFLYIRGSVQCHSVLTFRHRLPLYRTGISLISRERFLYI